MPNRVFAELAPWVGLDDEALGDAIEEHLRGQLFG